MEIFTGNEVQKENYQRKTDRVRRNVVLFL